MKQCAAEIIYDQIRMMDKMCLWDWGCMRMRPKISSDLKTLTMKSSGMVPWKGYIEITLDEGMDLYDITFYRMRKPRKSASNPYPIPEKKIDKEVSGVYFDMLIPVIDTQVLKRKPR